MDLGDSVGRAVHAARRGDLEGLEIELKRLRGAGLENVASVATRLKALARSARSHPSYKEMPQAQAV